MQVGRITAWNHRFKVLVKEPLSYRSCRGPLLAAKMSTPNMLLTITCTVNCWIGLSILVLEFELAASAVGVRAAYQLCYKGRLFILSVYKVNPKDR